MGLGINNNDVLRPLSQLGQINKKLDKSNQSLATGKRINQAYDDIVGAFKAASLTSAINESTINQNLNEQAQASLGVSGGTLFQNLDTLQNLRDLAVQASDDSVDASSRQAIVVQANDNLATISSGAPAIDLSSSAGARSSVSVLDSALEHITSQIASNGSQSQVLDVEIKANQNKQENLLQARSLIEDTDFAAQLSNNASLQINRAAVIKALQSANEVKKKSLLNLIT